MNICFVLDEPGLYGGVKVVFQYAEMLRNQGQNVSILAKGKQPEWSNYEGPYVDYKNESPVIPRQDLVICTYYTTYPFSKLLNIGPVVHYCQGIEADFEHLQHELKTIDEFYQLKLPTLTITPHLQSDLKKRYNRDAFLLPPMVDASFSANDKVLPSDEPWICVSGIFEAPFKNIPIALQAINLIRARGFKCRVLRISAYPLSDDEKKLLVPDKYLHNIVPDEVADAIRECDLILFSSIDAEGFGLPLLEAMASGIPAAACDIPSVRYMTNNLHPLCDPTAPEQFANTALNLLTNPDKWNKAKQLGLALAERFKHKNAKARLQVAFQNLVDYTYSARHLTIGIYLNASSKIDNSEEVQLARQQLMYNMRKVFGNVVWLEDQQGVANADYLLMLEHEQIYLSELSLRTVFINMLRHNANICYLTALQDVPTECITAIHSLKNYEDCEREILNSGIAFSVPENKKIAVISLLDLPKIDRESIKLQEWHINPLPSLPKRILATGLYLSFDYYGSERHDLLPYIPQNTASILDIGCAEGSSGRIFRNKLNCKIFGVEINPDVALIAEKSLDHVYVGNFEDCSIEEKFDVVIAADVVEHQVNIHDFLRKMVSLTNKNGRVLLSLPNIGHHSIIESLLAGRWDYVPIGLLCVTHVRFFTKKTIVEWFSQMGFDDVEVHPAQQTSLPDRFNALSELFDLDMTSLKTLGFYVVINVN
ncbi:methyltransferase domain-containing protein [Algibacillus agarilyticus]|uniref:methyltransferase domain-containing protein n=1 Tax=Algibacillus agarilyticus TaxID=2234133 RepID=UPI000DD09EF6|nr:methyltransferase domain-containing protein [Algibacillus agarilyticus]